ncbi:MAG: urate hydroxylase PuuD [Rhodoferax sp.]|nr:urate hydroxylase PuuD [Rhodoferax sp.]
MESYYLDWANLLLRWLHVITAIAWIGSSFYFVFLDSSLVPPESQELKDQGVGGELWAVHGGGFYNPQKYAVAPKVLPQNLHWFYWESYSTWLSGMALFTVSYLWSASTYLIDKSLMNWSSGAAIGVALSFLAVFWIVYDLICQAFGRRKHGDAIVGALVLLVVCFASWLACHWFAGRAAFLLVGAMIATAMTANVFFWIIPGQRSTVQDLREGRPVNPIHGQRAKQRSVHNTYFTLPVLFAMLSNHYSFTYTHQYNWLVLILMMFAGAAIRQFFVMRHGFKLGRSNHPWPYALVGVAVIIGAIVWMKPAAQAAVALAPSGAPAPTGQAGGPAFADIQKVMEQRCYQCHGPAVQMKNVRLDSAQSLKQHAQSVYQQVVVTKVMPMNNSTRITDAERALIAQWFRSGARTD